MKCFQCSKGKLVKKLAPVSGSLRGEPYSVHVESLVCTACGDISLTETQASAYNIALADAYRSAHGLLTTTEIRAARERLGLTQQTLADRLKVGIASVKRWEAGAVQDESSDQLIRLRTDIDVARINLRDLESRLLSSENRGPVVLPVRPASSVKWNAELSQRTHSKKKQTKSSCEHQYAA